MTNEEANMTIDYLKEMQEGYIEGEGYERHPLPEWYALDKAIETIEQTTWVPVSERLPETEERILILFDDGFVMIGHYIDWQDGTPITWVLDGQEDYIVDTNNIIAWMPLPPSYQGE